MAVWREGMTGPLGDKADLRPAEGRSRIPHSTTAFRFRCRQGLGENPRGLMVMDLAENCRSPGSGSPAPR